MDLNFHLGSLERLEGRPALIAYVLGATIGTAFALPILVAVFGLSIPLI